MRHQASPYPLLRAALLLVVTSGMVACVQPVANPNGIFASQPRVLIPDERNADVTFPASQPLRSGQIFALELTLDQPAHVYVIHRRGGVFEGLYPDLSSSDSELPSGTIRLPGRDTWMRVPTLDKHSRLCILLSATSLDPQQRHCPSGPRPSRTQAVQPILLSPTRQGSFPF